MIDAARLEIYRHLLAAVTEQMGVTLERVSHSANIKERRDFSCALFDADGRLIAQAEHIPVHLGSMPDALAAARRTIDFLPGDAVLVNDPFAGGTHLPDVTLIEPVFFEGALIAYVCNRAHHADIGGAAPGSMAASKSIYAEGFRIPPVRWYAAGAENADITRLLLANVRTPAERLGDLQAQRAANAIGARECTALLERIGRTAFDDGNADLLDYAERLMRDAIRAIPDGRFDAADQMDDDGAGAGPLAIRVSIDKQGDAVTVDFAGTSPAAAGCVNCPLPVTQAAVYYCFACLADAALPRCEGMFRPIRIAAPPGCLVNAGPPHAVAGGNVETSQRIVDVTLMALARALPGRIPANAAGTMSSLTLGGPNPHTGVAFTYYETIAGGMGASPTAAGESAVQTHMTNTRNTPAEALEMTLPLRVRQYAVRTGSGGAGAHRGGDGILREIESLVDGVEGALLADRHTTAPAGSAGGDSGAPGRLTIVRASGETEMHPAKGTFILNRGDRVCVQTPGGGGFGKP